MKKQRKKTGLPPGSVVFVGDQKVDKVFVHFLQYDQSNLIDNKYDSHEVLTLSPSSDEVVDWYDVRGLHDLSLIHI